MEYAIALGMFDSLHIAHRAVLNAVSCEGCQSMVMTFDSLPNKYGGCIFTEDEKKQMLIDFGIENVVILPFQDIKNMEAEDFLDYLMTYGDIKKIACGFNFRFGKNAAGDTSLIEKYCAEKEIECFIVPEVKANGKCVSTTHIKKLLANGDIKKANALLTVPFFITSKVIEGDKRGRSLGFPTVNQKYPVEKARMKFGVYETEIEIDGVSYRGVTNLGIRPTFPTEEVFAETYIIDYSGDCYEKDLKLSFVDYIREEKTFESIDALRFAINADVLSVKNK